MSKDFFQVDEEQEKVRGAISIFPGKDKKMLEKNVGRYRKELSKIAGILPSIKMIFRSSLDKYMPTISDDELYIEAIAVFSEYRGQKIASALLKKAFEYAKQKGLPKVSLLAETPNEHAIMIYKKYGFKITETQEFKKKYLKHELYGVHKMVAEVHE
jgi:ribosomal protein S18 acetylase RimI-like enzyme